MSACSRCSIPIGIRPNTAAGRLGAADLSLIGPHLKTLEPHALTLRNSKCAAGAVTARVRHT